MDMIGHQHIGMDPTAGFSGTHAKTVQIKPEILFGKKTGLSIIATLNDVQGNAGERKARASRHWCLWTVKETADYQENVVCPQCR